MKLRELTNKDICDMNGLDTALATNVIEEKLLKQRIRSILNIIAKIESGTVGPYGATTLIQKPGTHLATKDGWDVLKELKMDLEPVGRIIIELLQAISSTQVNVVGDGSTSAILVANALYSALTEVDVDNEVKSSKDFSKYTTILNEKILKYCSNDSLKEYNEYDELLEEAKNAISTLPPKDINNILLELNNLFETEILKNAKRIDGDMAELDHIAAVSNNNDLGIGKKIADLYREIGDIGRVTSSTSMNSVNDTIEYVSGLNWDFGYFDKAFSVSKANGIVDNGETIVFISKEELTTDMLEGGLGDFIMKYHTENLNSEDPKVRAKKGRHVLILAPNLDHGVLQFCRLNRTKHLHKNDIEIEFTVAGIHYSTDEAVSRNETIALLSGATIFDTNSGHTFETIKEYPELFAGTLKSMAISSKHSQVDFDEKYLNEDQKKKKDDYIVFLQDEIKYLENKAMLTTNEELNLFTRKKQLSYLNGKNAIIHVGGRTDHERNTRERLIEDSIKACRSAMRSGYVVGGNLVIPKLIYNNFESICNEIYDKFPYLNNIILFDEKYDDVKIDKAKLVIGQFIQMISTAFSESYMHVLNNAKRPDNVIDDVIVKCIKDGSFFNLRKFTHELDDECNIINPAETDIQIMKNCFSIIGILATTNQFVVYSTNLQTSKN